MVTKVLEEKVRERDFKSSAEKWFRPVADKEWGLIYYILDET